MSNNLNEKINVLKKLYTDDSRFIINVYEAYLKHQENLESKIKCSSIILKDIFSKSSPNIVDLDQIYASPYFYTQMRIKLNYIIEKLSNANISEIEKNSAAFCKKIISNNVSKKFPKIEEDKIDIVDFIKILNQKKSENKDYNSDFIFIAKTIDEEALFKEEQLRKAIEIMNINSKAKQYEKIYDEVYSYLKTDFVANNYCDFQDNKCIAQRHFTFYPFNKKNGCCFTRVRTCTHLQKGGSCNVECMACRLFSCPYLSKRGVTYLANEFVLLKAFLNKKQRKHFVFDFYQPKEKILKKLWCQQAESNC